MSARLEALRGAVADGRLTGLLVTHVPNVRYLSDFTGSAGFLLVEPRAATLFTDFRYAAQAPEEVAGGIDVEILADGNWTALDAWFRTSPAGRRVGFEADRLSVGEHERLAAACAGVIWEPTAGLVEALRLRKDPAEIEAIEAAVDLGDLVLESLLPVIRPGVSEAQIAAILEFRLRAAGSGALPFEPIVAFGARSALPHAAPTDRTLERGDLVLLDFGARIDGYCSDMTRAFTSGAAAQWQRDVHGEVRAACEAAIGTLRAGVEASTVDRAARDSLAAADLAEHFGHSTGHGLGLEIHEAPRLHRSETAELAAGNVVTVEPGVYLPGRGGVRLEQVAAVGETGARILTRSPLELVEL